MIYRMSMGRRFIFTVMFANIAILFLVMIVASNSIAVVEQNNIEQSLADIDDAISSRVEDEMIAWQQVAAELASLMEDAAPGERPEQIVEVLSGKSIPAQRISLYFPADNRVFIYDFQAPGNYLVPSQSREIHSAALAQTLGTEAWNLKPDQYTSITLRDKALLDPNTESAIGASIQITYANSADPSFILWIDVPQSAFQEAVNRWFAFSAVNMPAGTITTQQNGSYTVIIDVEKQQLLASYRLPENRSGLPREVWDLIGTMKDGQIVDKVDPFSGSSGFAFISRFRNLNWAVFTFMPNSVFPSLTPSAYVWFIVISLAGLAFLTWVINRLITRVVAEPLAKMGVAAQEIGSGDMRYRIEYQFREDEIGRLARALENMKQNLSHSYEQLSQWGRTLEVRVSQRTQELTQRTLELEEARKEAHLHAAEVSAVYAESLYVVNESQLKPILQAFMNRLIALLNASYCGVWLINSDRSSLQLVATTDSGHQRLNAVVGIDEGLVGQAVKNGEPIIVDDYAHYEHRIHLIGEEQPLIYRALCVPLVFAGRAIGAVVVGRKQPAPIFDDDNLRKLSLFANLVSPAVRNAQLLVQRDTAVMEAQRANEVKTRFLASVTHELRTPLNLIINNLDFMRIGQFGEVSPEQVNRIDQTIRSAEHLLYLINDLLDVSKIEAGEMQLFIQPTDVGPIIDDALDSAEMLMEKLNKRNKVTFTTSIAVGLPKVPMDARRIRQVLINLLGNAVKFTEEGRVHFSVAAKEDYIEFNVTDTGIGVPEDEIPKLFEAFERSTAAKKHNIEGTGLGLPISLYLVHQHGGTIDVKSELGKGSTFSFTLPLSPLPEDSLERKLRRADTQLMAVLAVHNE